MANVIPILGSVTSINLIAGAGILGNIGGYPIDANANLTNSISSYTTLSVVSSYASIVNTGYIGYNTVSNTFPALTNGVPTAYQSQLSTILPLTTVLNNHIGNVLGDGDIGKFDQILSSSSSFVFTTNQLIASALNAANAKTTTGYVSQDNTITGGVSDLTQAFESFADDFARLGFLINFENLDNLGSPASLLQQINNLALNTPALIEALLSEGLSADDIDNPDTAWTLAQQKQIYQAMTRVTGQPLTEILKLLRVTTAGINTLADLLNPVKIFPQSFNTLTAPTVNGLRGIYINNTGTVNSNLETQLPTSVLIPLQGNTLKGITYSNLRQVIPPDQALANKAITAALQQIKTIFNTSGPAFSTAVRGLESNKGLNQINSLTEPLPTNVFNYFSSTYAQGTGTDGIYLLSDLIGTPAGWVVGNAIGNTVAILSAMTLANAFFTLTNTSTGVYPTMANTAAGNYTTCSTIDPGPPIVESCTTTIPGGLPGAGSYVGSSSSESIQLAFTNGLIPAFISAVGNIVANNTSNVNQTNTNWNNISAQIVREKDNLVRAGVVYANLIPNTQATGLVTGLPGYGLDVVQGGAAYVLEGIANTSTQGGQAMISTMRESRNSARLNSAGIQLTPLVEDTVTEPEAALIPSQYSVSEAVSQKII
jgi:hypothetical protein